MPTPAIYQQGGPDPFAHVLQEDRTNEVPVYYVTDREPTGQYGLKKYYSGNRSKDLRVGRASVLLGSEDLSWEELCRESRLEKRSRNPKIKLTNISEYGTIWSREFAQNPGRPVELPSSADHSEAGARFVTEINNRLAKFPQKNIYIYIHGFKNSFTSCVTLSAQMWHYLGRDGVFISYSWPSRDKLALYTVDKGNAMFSVRNFRLLLKYLAEKTDVDQIHIIAHSAGTGVPVAAFSQMSLLDFEKDPSQIWNERKIGNVVLAAPDIDLEIFVNAGLDGSNRIPKRMTLYASREDKALNLSGKIFEMARLGNPFEKVSIEEMKQLRRAKDRAVVDVTPAQARHDEFLGHSYFHTNFWVSSDLFLFLRSGLDAQGRGLVPLDDGAFWTFPEGYGDRVKQLRYQPKEELFSEPAARSIRPLPPAPGPEPLLEITPETGRI